MSGERKPLNLDELYGTARPVVVVWEGKRYELRRPEALTPIEYSRWLKLQAKSGSLMSLAAADEMTEEQANELDEVIGTALGIFCPELAKQNLPFMAKVRTLQFYTDEAFGVKVDGSKNPIGA